MRIRRRLVIVLMACSMGLHAQPKGRPMEAKGTFEVKVAPAEQSPFEKSATLTRYTLEKVWQGDFEGTSQGEMLAADAPPATMAYVAMERMSGKLAGKTGAFLFSHRASMVRGDSKSAVMSVTIVPNSGTGELMGIAGSLTIDIREGKHFWALEYTLP